MVTKREIYAIIAGYGLGKVLPAGSTVKTAKRTVFAIARPAGKVAIGLAKRHPGVAIGTGLVAAHQLGYLDPVYAGAKPVKKRAMSKFNKSVKGGMSIIRASTSYGSKGTINNAKKAFAAVTKTVSKVWRKKATPKKGPMSAVARYARKIAKV